MKCGKTHRIAGRRPGRDLRCAGARRGFTFLEAMLAAGVVAAAVPGVLLVANASFSLTRQMREDAVAQELACQLMTEITARPFVHSGTSDNSGWPASNNRAQYDNIMDYNGYTDNTAYLTDGAGARIQLSVPGTYRRSVSVTTPASTSLATTPSDFLIVAVSVTEPCGKVYTLRQLMTSAGLQRQNGGT